MARLYANENFPLPVVEELRRLGHDVMTTSEAGEAGRAAHRIDVEVGTRPRLSGELIRVNRPAS